MNTRETLVAAALQGFIAHHGGSLPPSQIAQIAVEIADATMKKLKEKKP